MPEEAMLEVFTRRKNRFRLLDAAVTRALWRGKAPELLEVGCGYGDAAAHLAHTERFNVTAIDLSKENIAKAKARNPESEGLRFLEMDAGEMDFESGRFDGVYCEAAFSVLPNKRRAAEEYVRVLKCGGKLIVNDFALRKPRDCADTGIPCMDGALETQAYCDIFTSLGLVVQYRAEDIFEFASIYALVREAYGLTEEKADVFLSSSFGSGAVRGPAMTYCSLIFEKPESGGYHD